jgi:hypothetical protein
LILGDIGGPAVMREQLDKLAGLAREPGDVLRFTPTAWRQFAEQLKAAEPEGPVQVEPSHRPGRTSC